MCAVLSILPGLLILIYSAYAMHQEYLKLEKFKEKLAEEKESQKRIGESGLLREEYDKADNE